MTLNVCLYCSRGQVRCRYTRTEHSAGKSRSRFLREFPVVIAMAAAFLLPVLIVDIIIIIIIGFSACSASLPVADIEQATPTATPTHAPPTIRQVQAATSCGTRRCACRLLAQDPYLSDRVRQMSADGAIHLIQYTIKFPDGSTDSITGRPTHFSHGRHQDF